MKFDVKKYGLYPIMLFLIYQIFRFFYYLTRGPVGEIKNSMIFGPYAWAYIILAIAALVTILFLDFKYKWIAATIPFFWLLLSPMQQQIGLPMMRGALFSVYYMFSHAIVELGIITYFLFLTLIITYLIMTQFAKKRSKNFEIATAIVLVILYFI